MSGILLIYDPSIETGFCNGKNHIYIFLIFENIFNRKLQCFLCCAGLSESFGWGKLFWQVWGLRIQQIHCVLCWGCSVNQRLCWRNHSKYCHDHRPPQVELLRLLAVTEVTSQIWASLLLQQTPYLSLPGWYLPAGGLPLGLRSSHADYQPARWEGHITVLYYEEETPAILPLYFHFTLHFSRLVCISCALRSFLQGKFNWFWISTKFIAEDYQKIKKKILIS